MMWILSGYNKLSYFSENNRKPLIRFSIVVPFRNEAENLPKLLESLFSLNYPQELFEVIFVNDASEDGSEIVLKNSLDVTSTLVNNNNSIAENNFNFRIIQNERFSVSPKKDAITNAIKTAQYEWVVTTDADCLVPTNWLLNLNSLIQKENPVMICGPVLYECNNSLLSRFQQFDGFSLQAMTMASFGYKYPLLCNGANLAYTKESFRAVKGFLGNEHVASGDDIFLMEKMKLHFPEQVLYLKSQESIVSTKPQNNWKNVINQRIRWASKTQKQKGFSTKIVGFLVFLTNILILFGVFWNIFHWKFIPYFLLFLFLKILIDFIILQRMSKFFRQKINIPSFFISTFIYPFIIGIVVMRSFTGSYQWKGRKFKNNV